jgi:hypothetical protein
MRTAGIDGQNRDWRADFVGFSFYFNLHQSLSYTRGIRKSVKEILLTEGGNSRLLFAKNYHLIATIRTFVAGARTLVRGYTTTTSTFNDVMPGTLRAVAWRAVPWVTTTYYQQQGSANTNCMHAELGIQQVRLPHPWEHLSL